MNCDGMLRLYRWLAATYLGNYRGLPDEEVKVRIGNLRYAFDGYDAADVIATYRTFLVLQKSEPSIADVLAVLQAKRPHREKQANTDYETRLKSLPGYADLEQQYGKSQTRRTAAICTTGTLEELKARLADGDD